MTRQHPGPSTEGYAPSGTVLDFTVLFDASPNPYVLLDRELNLAWMNQAYLDVTGRSREELTGRNMFEAFPSDPASPEHMQLRGSFERILNDGTTDHLPLIRYAIEKKGGGFEERFWSATHTPLMGPDGRVAFILQHTQDVTELHRLRQFAASHPHRAGTLESGLLRRAEALREQNVALASERSYLRDLFEQAPGFMAVLRGRACVFELANASYRRLVGERTLIGKPIREAMPELADQGYFELLDRVYTTGEPYVGTGVRVDLVRTRKLPPEERFVDIIYHPILDEAGEVIAIFVQGHDVTEAKKAEAALRESEARFRLVADNAPVMIWMSDPAGNCIYLNHALRAFWNVGERDVAGFDWTATLHPDDTPSLLASLSEAMQKQAAFTVEGRHRRSDGDWRILATTGHPRFASDGTFLGAIGVNVDVTEARATAAALQDLNVTLEEQVAERTRELRVRDEALRQAQKMEVVGQLTGGVAHDFNNLLQIVMGNLEILQRNLPEDAGRLRRSADSAMMGAKRAATLTQRLLAFSRRQPLAPRPLSPNRLIGDMSELLHRTIGESIDIEIVLGARGWNTEVDANQLEGALLNLTLNARDAMPTGGKLTIETANTRLDDSYAVTHAEVQPGQYVVICVTDTGSGMDKMTIERAFEPFFTTKDASKGTGLGLSMVYGFVKQSGGHVKIYSEIGQGTTVKIYLPRYAGDIAEDDPIVQQPIPEGSAKESILVLEDDDAVRAHSAEILRELGYSVIEARDGPSALKLLGRDPDIGLLFTDVVLGGGITGADVAREAVAARPGLKVLFTTGYARDAIIHQGRIGPGVQLITKPFTYAELARRVRDVLDLS